jgi:hypothetical protein
MICLDCLSDDRERHAVAVCTGCGAAVCRDHSRVREHTLTRTVVGGMMFMTVPVVPATRLVRCLHCDIAHSARYPDLERGRAHSSGRMVG